MQMRSLLVAALLGVANAVDVQIVYVGMNPATNQTGLKYWPEKVTAEPGTMVQFQFLAGKHTITQSNFDNPCIPVGNIDPSVTGIYSGSMDVAAAAAQGITPTYSVMVTDKKPIWLYCTTGPHCASGMSMVINENTSANSSRSLENYKSIAATFQGTSPQPNSSGGDGSAPAPSSSSTPPTPSSGAGSPDSGSPNGDSPSSTFVTSPAATGTAAPGETPSSTLAPSSGTAALSAPLALLIGAIGAAFALA